MVFIIPIFLVFCGAVFIARLVGQDEPPAKQPRFTPDPQEDLVRRLRQLAAECTDGSVRIIEPKPRKRRSSVPPASQTRGDSFDKSIVWARHHSPPQRCRIEYADRNGEYSERIIDLLSEGTSSGHVYWGVKQDGNFKTLRADRILKAEYVLSGEAVRLPPSHTTPLPPWPLEGAVFKINQTHGKRRWTVDLNAYTCTCPEKRERLHLGAKPGHLGVVCSHMAEAILSNFPPGETWNDDLVAYLRDPQRVAMSAWL